MFVTMEDTESRRTRKPVNYAEIADVILDDDFADFKNSPECTTDKVKYRKEPVGGEEQKDNRERKHSKDKHRDHKKHKKDKHREDRDRHRSRHSKERDERKTREHKEREQRSERKDSKHSQDSSKGEGSSDSTSDSSGTQLFQDSPSTSVPATTSPLVSPSRRNPKPRLSLQDKLFQRELEAVLELSKVEPSPNPSNTPEPKDHEGTEEGTALHVKQEAQSLSNPKSLQGLNIEGDRSPPTQAFPSALKKASVPKCVEVVTKKSDPPAPAGSMDTTQPQPSTSWGKTAKRIRKTVVFKEDSDSDFGGFGSDQGAVSDASECSDFMPSPRKKIKSKDSKKTKNSKPTKNSAQKSSIKSTDPNRAGDVMSSPQSHPVLAKENRSSPQSHPVLAKKNRSSPQSHPVLAKENSDPKHSVTPPRAKTTDASPRVSTTPELKVSLGSSVPSQAKPLAKKTSDAKPVKRPMISIASSPSSGPPSIALVKTPFRNPLSTSPNSGHHGSPTASVGNQSLYRSTGLRLGLSRRANIKPLHPNVAGNITN